MLNETSLSVHSQRAFSAKRDHLVLSFTILCRTVLPLIEELFRAISGGVPYVRNYKWRKSWYTV